MICSLLFGTFLALLWHGSHSHSQMTAPQSTSPSVCYLGGDPKFNIGYCPGPCDLKAVRGRYANYDSPNNPAAVYKRGERIKIKYQRNNHGPGGFIRLTLVPPSKLMNKKIHSRNAFHWSCFGANVHVLESGEKILDRWGFSLIGNDGRHHDFPKAYYESYATIPDVLPDGKYVLGWVWFGGVGGPIYTNKVQAPTNLGYFSDYWSCSFVHVRGGVALKARYAPVFQNDMKQFSTAGCMSANESPGVCTFEPCRNDAKFRKPSQFTDGKMPTALTPEHFK